MGNNEGCKLQQKHSSINSQANLTRELLYEESCLYFHHSIFVFSIRSLMPCAWKVQGYHVNSSSRHHAIVVWSWHTLRHANTVTVTQCVLRYLHLMMSLLVLHPGVPHGEANHPSSSTACFQHLPGTYAPSGCYIVCNSLRSYTFWTEIFHFGFHLILLFCLLFSVLCFYSGFFSFHQHFGWTSGLPAVHPLPWPSCFLLLFTMAFAWRASHGLAATL